MAAACVFLWMLIVFGLPFMIPRGWGSHPYFTWFRYRIVVKWTCPECEQDVFDEDHIERVEKKTHQATYLWCKDCGWEGWFVRSKIETEDTWKA